MLETQIKALNESIQANTAMLEKVLAAMTNNTPVIAKAVSHESLSETVEEIKPDIKTEAKTAKAKTAKAKTAKAKPAIEAELETTDIVTDIVTDITIDIVTANDLKGLAKGAIADGVLRTDIKKLITDVGADTLSALDDEQRVKVFNALTKLKGE